MPSTIQVLINVLLKQFLGGVRRYFKQYGFQLEKMQKHLQWI